MRWLFIIALLLAPAAAGAEGLDYDAFGQTPVLHDGRIKPLDSLARVMAARICGREQCPGRPASQWLAFMLFTPKDAMNEPMMAVSRTQAARMLGLSARPDGLYSFAELAAALPLRAEAIHALALKDKSSLTADEAEVLRVYAAAGDFTEVAGTFSLLLPMGGMDDAVRARLHVAPGAGVAYFDLLKDRQSLEEKARSDEALAPLVVRMRLQEQLDGDNALVRLIPPAWGGEEWFSPWAVLKSSGGSPASAVLLRNWRALAASYRAQDAKGWQETSQALRQSGMAALTPFAALRLILEWYYNRLHLLLLAACCYALALGLALAPPRFARAGHAALLLGLALHASALTLRMVILLRPPVSTLYESLIFVSFVVTLASACLGARGKGDRALVIGTGSGLLLLLVSWVFAGSGDTLGVVVAVLNTNFWLATHVVCITTGYASTLMAGALAHYYLFRRAVTRADEEALAPLATLLHRVALLALFFTATGTMLGGIWADQSWGRFWGWDPKENGALLIVLWLTWALHGRLAGQLKPVGFAAVVALANIVVALAWIGVNLLGIGLHSYGFTDVAADGLIAFCTLEIAYVLAMLVMLRFGSGIGAVGVKRLGLRNHPEETVPVSQAFAHRP